MSKAVKSSPEADLRTQVLAGFKWLAAAKFMGQLINWGISFWVIRLLAPSDYGLMAMASSFVVILALFNEMGMGAVLIQAKELSGQLIRQVFGITLVINLTLFCLLELAAPLIGLFFGEPQLIPILRVLALEFVVTSFLIVPQALMDRELAFREKSLVDLCANLLAGGVSLYLAYHHHGVWSLVWAVLVLIGVRTLGYNFLRPQRCLPSFDFKGMKSSVHFGGLITLEKVIWYFYSQADVLIIGKILGKEILGFYSVGKHLAGLLSDKIMPIVNQVVFPAFSRIQGREDAVARALLKGISMISLVAFPAFWGISVVSGDLVPFVLGEKWVPSVLPLMMISLIIPLRMVSGIFISALRGIKRADVTFINSLVPLFIMVPAFGIGCFWGKEGVCLAWVLVYPLCFCITSFRSTGYFLFRY
ncbi:MAG: lipopolysaccharide biosynthesis protein, partial [Desulfobacterales bacterium]|nr:lipopolysaccharide biosynthesis protein [Desulfobacterales bacterium]